MKPASRVYLEFSRPKKANPDKDSESTSAMSKLDVNSTEFRLRITPLPSLRSSLSASAAILVIMFHLF